MRAFLTWSCVRLCWTVADTIQKLSTNLNHAIKYDSGFWCSPLCVLPPYPYMHNMWQQFNCFSSSCCACADTGFFYFSLSFYIVATAVNIIWLVRLLASRAAC